MTQLEKNCHLRLGNFSIISSQRWKSEKCYKDVENREN